MEGIDKFARCLNCGDVCWTETTAQDQAVQCRCNFLRIENDRIVHARGGIDRGYTEEHFAAHLASQ
jgi:hypothetical protein